MVEGRHEEEWLRDLLGIRHGDDWKEVLLEYDWKKFLQIYDWEGDRLEYGLWQKCLQVVPGGNKVLEVEKEARGEGREVLEAVREKRRNLSGRRYHGEGNACQSNWRKKV